MAKKKTNSRSRSKAATGTALATLLSPTQILPPTPGVQANVVIDKTDMLMVALTEAEDHMNAKVKEESERRDAETARGNALRTEAHASCLRLAEQLSQEGRDPLAFGLKAFGYKDVTFGIQVELLTGRVRTEDDGEEVDCVEDEVENTIYGAAGSKQKATVYHKFRATLTVTAKRPDGGYAGAIAQRVHHFPYTEDAVMKLRDAEQATANAAEAGKQAIEWKQRALQLPSLERRYRGRLARERIVATEGGSELLAAILGDISADVLKLPTSR